MVSNLVIVVCVLSLLNICWGFIASIQAPFLPIEARLKGATAGQFGPIFGIIHLALFLVSPWMGRAVTKLGLGTVFRAGLVMAAVAGLLFGFLTYINNTALFLVAAYFLRILEGIGGAALWTAMLSLLLASFPKNTGMVYSLIDATFGLGYTLGPVIGAFLYNLGGFLLPFLVSSLALVVTGCASVWRSQSLAQAAEQEVEDGRSSLNIGSILCDHASLVSLLSATTAALTIGYLESLLELHLETMFSASVTIVGLCFLTMSVSYTLVTIISGYCADKLIHPGSLTIIGLLLLLASLILLGPAPFLPLPPSFAITILGLLLQGAGAGAVIVSSYSSALRATLMIPGFSSSVSTYSIVSGLWTSAFALGNFAGPSVAGIIYEQIGFQWGTVMVEVILVIMLILNLVMRRQEMKTRRRMFNDQVYEEFKSLEVLS